MSSLSRAEVAKLAKLARIELTDSEMDALSSEFAVIWALSIEFREHRLQMFNQHHIRFQSTT